MPAERVSGALQEIPVHLAPNESVILAVDVGQSSIAQLLQPVGASGRATLTVWGREPIGPSLSPIAVLDQAVGRVEVVLQNHEQVPLDGVVAVTPLTNLGVALDPLFTRPVSQSPNVNEALEDPTPSIHASGIYATVRDLIEEGRRLKKAHPDWPVTVTIAANMIARHVTEDRVCWAAIAGVRVRLLQDRPWGTRYFRDLSCHSNPNIEILEDGGVLEPSFTVLHRMGFVMLDPGNDSSPARLLIGFKNLTIPAVSGNHEAFVLVMVPRSSPTARRHQCAALAVRAAAGGANGEQQLAAFNGTFGSCAAGIPAQDGPLTSYFGPSERTGATEALLARMSTATSIDLAALYFGDMRIADALREAASHPGVRVRALLDDDVTYGEPRMGPEDRDVWFQLRQEPWVRVVVTNPSRYSRRRQMLRTVVVDERSVMLRGGDFRPDSTPARSETIPARTDNFLENVYFVDDERVAAAIAREVGRIHAEVAVAPAALPAPEYVFDLWAEGEVENGGLILDIRPLTETPRDPNDLRIPAQQLGARYEELGSLDRAIFVVDAVGAVRVVDDLRARGFTRVSILRAEEDDPALALEAPPRPARH